MGAKKIAVMVVMIAVIVAAVVFFLKGSGLFGTPKPPERILGLDVERIDVNTGEVITLKLAEWTSLGHRDGLFKNPNSGQYSMQIPMICGGCGEKIATPARVPSADGVSTSPGPCPKCGKNPYAHPGK
jgi:hypothetical protein